MENCRLLVLTEFYDKKAFQVNFNNLEISILPKLKFNRSNYATFYFEKKVYIIGGNDDDSLMSESMVENEIYDSV